MTAVDRDPVTLAREVLDAVKAMDDTPGTLYLDGPTHEHEEAAGAILDAAPALVAALKSNQIQAIVAQKPAQMGALAVETGETVFEGHPLAFIEADEAGSEVDDAEAASTYQAYKVQLEALYTVMANLSELRFSNYMR